MFYIKVKDLSTRSELLEYLKEHDIGAVFHYIPLHSAPAGIKFGVFDDVDEFTTKESERLIRLPMYYGLDNKSIAIVVKTIENYIRI